MTKPLVCIVDDERAVLDVVKRMIQSGGYDCRCYQTANELLDAFDESVDCVVTDLKMPEMDGAELLEKIRELDRLVSVVVLTAHADIPTTVNLMQQGAVSLIEKPVDANQLLSTVDKAIELTRAQRRLRSEANDARRRIHSLSANELDVLREMISGAPNKAIAMRLQISSRTLDRRRQHILEVMKLDSVAELATVVARYNLLDD
ncbi:response regulator transcription factor [Novipirellula herctigrandis]